MYDKICRQVENITDKLIVLWAILAIVGLIAYTVSYFNGHWIWEHSMFYHFAVYIISFFGVNLSNLFYIDGDEYNDLVILSWIPFFNTAHTITMISGLLLIFLGVTVGTVIKEFVTRLIKIHKDLTNNLKKTDNS